MMSNLNKIMINLSFGLPIRAKGHDAGDERSSSRGFSLILTDHSFSMCQMYIFKKGLNAFNGFKGRLICFKV